ncbi:hypothetical protein ACLIBG_14035, partial [Virgibacillus sp. W0181]|uniref:hypothetical protein n=1 Tax=Virgibacillus sp. W0181 TaxID=3391581 RepID=UPI003F449BBB
IREDLTMQEMIDKIYHLIHTPLVTPYNLLDNSRLNNYNYVKYYREEAGLVCEMECDFESDLETFFYFFDEKDYLQKIERDLGSSEREVLFDRAIEVEKHKQAFTERNSNGKKATIG